MAGGPTEGGPDVGGLTAGGPGSPLARRPGNGDILCGGTLGVSGQHPFPEGQSPIRDLRGQEDSWREAPDRL